MHPNDYQIIKENIDYNGYTKHYDFIVKILDGFADDGQKSQIEELSNLLTEKIIENDSSKKEFTIEKEDDYPFSKEEAKKQLATALSGLEDENEIKEIRKSWSRQWAKSKAEYDQKVKKQKKLAEKEKDSYYESLLKKAK